MDEEVTATQAAALTGVSERTIRRKIAAGQLPARRVAPNRFAIAMRDLPQRRGVDALAGRIEVIEQRLDRLEGRLQFLAEGLSRLLPGEIQPAEAPAAEATPVASLRDLLAQLAQEVERLSPLLTADAMGDDGADTAAPPWYDKRRDQRRSGAQSGRKAQR